MTNDGTNGRIRLTWQQITWAITTLVLIVASYFDAVRRIDIVANRLDIARETYSKTEIDLMRQESMVDRQKLNDRLDRLENNTRLRRSNVSRQYND